jgi:phosphoribosylformylglycinamidine synthase
MGTISPDVLTRHGLTEDEYERIRKALGRDPNLTELGLFSSCGRSTAPTRAAAST